MYLLAYFFWFFSHNLRFKTNISKPISQERPKKFSKEHDERSQQVNCLQIARPFLSLFFLLFSFFFHSHASSARLGGSLGRLAVLDSVYLLPSTLKWPSYRHPSSLRPSPPTSRDGRTCYIGGVGCCIGVPLCIEVYPVVKCPIGRSFFRLRLSVIPIAHQSSSIRR